MSKEWSQSETRSQALQQLGLLGMSQDLLKHARLVESIAVSIAFRMVENSVSIAVDQVGLGALFHDVGYVRQSGLRHGIVGAEIVRELGYPKSVAAIVETHVLGGISEDIIRTWKLDLPEKDLVPVTLEGKVVAFADQLVHLRGHSDVFMVEGPELSCETAKVILRLAEEVCLMCFCPTDSASSLLAGSVDKQRVTDIGFDSRDVAE